MNSASPGIAQITGATVATVATVAAILLTDLTVWQKAAALIPGLGLGAWAGRVTGRELEHRVDRGGGLVLYVTDGVPYGLLFPLALLSLGPFAFGTMVRAVSQSAEVRLLLQMLLCAFAGAWLSYDVVMARRLRRINSELGPLKVYWFYAPSVVGPEGMIGRTAVVTSECVPIGYVQLGGELWKAESLDGTRLTAGQRVRVRRLNGLVVMIEPDEMT